MVPLVLGSQFSGPPRKKESNHLKWELACQVWCHGARLRCFCKTAGPPTQLLSHPVLSSFGPRFCFTARHGPSSGLRGHEVLTLCSACLEERVPVAIGTCTSLAGLQVVEDYHGVQGQDGLQKWRMVRFSSFGLGLGSQLVSWV